MTLVHTMHMFCFVFAYWSHIRVYHFVSMQLAVYLCYLKFFKNLELERTMTNWFSLVTNYSFERARFYLKSTEIMLSVTRSRTGYPKVISKSPLQLLMIIIRVIVINHKYDRISFSGKFSKKYCRCKTLCIISNFVRMSQCPIT